MVQSLRSAFGGIPGCSFELLKSTETIMQYRYRLQLMRLCQALKKNRVS